MVRTNAQRQVEVKYSLENKNVKLNQYLTRITYTFTAM